MPRRRRKRKEKAVPAPAAEPPGRWDRLSARLLSAAGSRWAAPAALVLTTFALYAGSIDCPLIYVDDNLYILEDARVQELSLGNVWRILTTSYAANYTPLTTLTFALDRAVWGTWLPGFHLTQLAFYSAGIVLLFFVFRAILDSAPAALVGALIYATHTVHVESVAWLASRKDVVCLVFYAAATLAYIRYAREGNWSGRRYALFALLAAAAMFSKGYAAVIPAALLAYDACLGERVGRRQFLDKLPLFALGAFLTVVMILAQEKDAPPILTPISLAHRYAAQCKIYAAYVGRTLLPVMLSLDYSYVVRSDWLNPGVTVLGAILGTGTICGFFLLRRRLPAAAFGIAVFVLQLGTVMSTFFTLRHWMSDRYLFFPTIGSTLALAAGGLWLYRNEGVPRALRCWAVPAAAVAAVAMYGILTVSRIGAWESEAVLWSDAVRQQLGLRGSGPLTARELEGQRLSYLGPVVSLHGAYMREGKREEADAIMEALGEVPEGLMMGNQIPFAKREIDAGRYDEAIRILRPVTERAKFWGAAEAWAWIGKAHVAKGEPEEARLAYEKAVDLGRKSGRTGAREVVGAMVELGTLDFKAGRFEEAARWYRLAREEAAADNPRPAFNLALALERLGKLEEAHRLCGEVLELEGRARADIAFHFADVCLEAGIIAEKLGRRKEAVRHLERALRLSPDHPQREGIRAKIRSLRGSPAGP